jgi:hypothetical protein
VDHTSHCEQDAKGMRCSKTHVCQNYPADVFQEHKWHKHHLCMKQEEDQLPFVDYIVVVMSNNLYDQNAHAKVCSSHRCEKQKLMEMMMTQSCQNCTTW